MQALLEHFITQSVMYSLIAVALVAFLESLALVGLILPGTVMMAGLWALVGRGGGHFLEGGGGGGNGGPRGGRGSLLRGGGV